MQKSYVENNLLSTGVTDDEGSEDQSDEDEEVVGEDGVKKRVKKKKGIYLFIQRNE